MLIILYIAFRLIIIFQPYINEYTLEKEEKVNDVMNGSYFVMNSIFIIYRIKILFKLQLSFLTLFNFFRNSSLQSLVYSYISQNRLKCNEW
ncbi:hypothetical protein B279_02660 [Streptococcus equinus ATCC 33317]|nr:hypothetical protein B279_02660 [Streptococcus equinus ATCC 33317]